ncbi:hypothetical protein PUN28_010252 [Cardiocondyla obscurior]|uniref:Uncharacterized protein n=1 Tax=Cardiocondyla obscurior TaxID=286306 RepID=A0AAW2FPB4_9HYME
MLHTASPICITAGKPARVPFTRYDKRRVCFLRYEINDRAHLPSIHTSIFRTNCRPYDLPLFVRYLYALFIIYTMEIFIIRLKKKKRRKEKEKKKKTKKEKEKKERKKKGKKKGVSRYRIKMYLK